MLNWRAYAKSAVEKSGVDASPDYFVPLDIGLGRRRNGTQDDLWQLIRSGQQKKVLLTGRPGCGKSFVIAYLHHKLAQELSAEIDTFDYNAAVEASDTAKRLLSVAPAEPVADRKPTDEAAVEDETTQSSTTEVARRTASRLHVAPDYEPSNETIVPILVQLNRFDRDRIPERPGETRLETKVLQTLRQYGSRDDLPALLQSGPRFIFLIDDLDEVTTHNWVANLGDVREFVEKVEMFPSVQVVLAGRSSAANLFKNKFPLFSIAHLSSDRVKEVFVQVLGRAEAEGLYAYVEKPEGLLAFLSTPYFAVAAADFWNDPGDKDFNLGRLLFMLISDLIYRQEKTENREHIYAAISSRVEALRQLAIDSLSTGGVLARSQVAATPAEYVEWYQFMEFVTSNVLELRFVSKWVHAYFAAHYLSDPERYPTFNERLAFLSSVLAHGSPPVVSACVVLLQDLTGEDYSAVITSSGGFADSFTHREREWFGWGFEQKVSEYIRETMLPDFISAPYKRPYLGDGEIDIYAEKKKTHNSKEVWIVECKFRLPPYPKALRPEYLPRLVEYCDVVRRQERPHAEAQGITPKFTGVLVTNNTDFSHHDKEHARRHGIQLWNVRLEASKLTARAKITAQMVERVL